MTPLRKISIVGDIAYIPLTKGFTAIIDASDAPLVESYNWCVSPGRNKLYALRGERRGGKSRPVPLHRAILGLTDGKIHVDHIDGDGLNNRRVNLRQCTVLENSWNRGAPRNNTSGFKGVSWRGDNRKWEAQIGVSGVKKHLGLFDKPEAAHAAYCEAAHKYFGEFARTA